MQSESIPRVLVVDDEAGVRLTLSANLELEGFEVTEADSAEDALRVLSENHFDVVLSDIRMPGQSGVELCRHLGTAHPDLPVVLMTAFTNEEQLASAKASGVFTILSKPFDISRVVKVLSSAVRAPVVLVVDDQEEEAHSLAALLRDFGVRAEAVFTGEDAVTAIQDREIDVCITDLVMPGLDGLEVFRRIRALRPDVGVVVFTGHHVPDMLHEAADAGAVQCLHKPLDPELLAHTIVKIRGAA